MQAQAKLSPAIAPASLTANNFLTLPVRTWEFLHWQLDIGHISPGQFAEYARLHQEAPNV